MTRGQRCEAELVTDLRQQPSHQCQSEATDTRDGHHVCWLHKGAVRQLSFVPQDFPVEPVVFDCDSCGQPVKKSGRVVAGRILHEGCQ